MNTKRVAIMISNSNVFIIPTIGYITQNCGYYKYRICFAWLGFKASVGFIKYELDLLEGE